MRKQSVSKTTPPISDEQLEALRTLMPQAFSEGKIDPEKLRAALGDILDDPSTGSPFGDYAGQAAPERYSFSWAGKRDAIRLMQVPSRATLIPCPEQGVFNDVIARAGALPARSNPHANEGIASATERPRNDTQNLFIEGDNLEVLKLLYKPYFGQVKMIYIDPPYNTGNDFVYPDNFADPLDTYLKLTGQKDSQGNLLTSNPETGGRYHSAWLSMMYPRLFLARQLLREDGVIFVSIDDHEVYNLRLLMNEIFGEENFVAQVVWQKKYSVSNDDRGIGSMHEYILVFAKSDQFDRGLLPRTEEQIERYSNPDNDPRGDWTSSEYISNKSKSERPTLYYPIIHPKTGKEVWPPEHAVWRYSRDRHEKINAEGRLYWGSDQSYQIPRIKRYLSEMNNGVVPSTWWPHTEAGHNDEGSKQFNEIIGAPKIFNNPKPVRLLSRILQIGAIDKDAIIIDFFAGSCTTAQAVLELNREDGGNRRFIMVQLPEPTGNKQFPTIAEIGKERIRRVVARMKDLTPGPSPKGSPKGVLREGEQARQLGMPLETRETPEDLGFKVFKLAPSNYRQWQGDPQGLQDPAGLVKQAELFADPLVEGWQPENVLYEVALKEGYGLNVTVEPVGAGLVPAQGDHKGRPYDMYRVTDPDKGQSFYLTLAAKIALEDLRPLDLKKDDLFICRDTALDDEAAANLALQCRLKTI